MYLKFRKENNFNFYKSNSKVLHLIIHPKFFNKLNYKFNINPHLPCQCLNPINSLIYKISPQLLS
jgi:hypothetical protein